VAEQSPPFVDSLCHRCVHLRMVQGARTAFLRCAAPSLPKYPRQPVVDCAAFTRRPAE
jgi:hypothetical protein